MSRLIGLMKEKKQAQQELEKVEKRMVEYVANDTWMALIEKRANLLVKINRLRYQIHNLEHNKPSHGQPDNEVMGKQFNSFKIKEQ